MQTDKALKASVVQFDYQGRVLWQSPVQHFTAGVHAIDAPKASTRSIYKLSVKR
jgi:endoglucanase